MNKLYRHAYLYTLAILILSIILAGVSMGLMFGRRERGLIERTFHRQVSFIRRETYQYETKSPERLPERLSELSEQLGWNIAYWRAGQLVYASVPKPPAYPSLKLPQRGGHRLHEIQLSTKYRPFIVVRVFPNSPNQGILWLELGPGSLSRPFRHVLLAMVLLLLFLAFLLIPFIRFLLRPYQDLQRAIHQLAEGNFEGKLEEKKYAAFEGLVSSFNSMQLRLQHMLQQKQRLVADVSHELRSPLTRMRVAMELLQQDKADVKELALKSIQEIEELNRIIDDVLEISRLQLHDLPLKVERLDLSLLLFEIAEQHQDLLAQKSLELQVDLPQQSVYLDADARLLQRLFNNLFNNLVKYVPGPGVVDLVLAESEQSISVRLRDHGPGISSDKLDEIFMPFHRLDFSRSRLTGGVGLGLAIVWEIVQAHHGTIQASLPEGGGLSFEIQLPRTVLHSSV